MKNIHSEQFRIGILGGGQLGRMTLQEAYNLNLHISILDPSAVAPCRHLAHSFVQGDFKDYETVLNFGRTVDVLTIEFEDVNSDALLQLEKEGIAVYPQANVLKTIQDKGKQKVFYQEHQFPTSPFVLVEGLNDPQWESIDYPIFQKLRTSGYDGYGVQSLRSKDDLPKAFDAPSVLEKGVELEKELSVIVGRNTKGECSCFPLVELEFNPEANMVEFLFSPANVSEDIAKQAYALAERLIKTLDMVGILAVEFFLSKDGELMVNEIAPRSHNSGHHTIEGNLTSQFAQHLRAILGLPLGATDSRGAAVMVNLLGDKGNSGIAQYRGFEEILKEGGVYPHLYGKEQVKPFRKMGHITIIDQDLESAKAKARKIKQTTGVSAAN